VEIYRRARQATDDNIIWCMRFVCWINKVTDGFMDFIHHPTNQILKILKKSKF
jgi:hypothetical protein